MSLAWPADSKSTAVGLALMSTDEFSAGLPVDVVQDPETLVVYEMNGVPLPREHGFPARLLVPGRYGMKNPKGGWRTSMSWTREFLGMVRAAELEQGRHRQDDVAHRRTRRRG